MTAKIQTRVFKMVIYKPMGDAMDATSIICTVYVCNLAAAKPRPVDEDDQYIYFYQSFSTLNYFLSAFII